jgi:hypothetical protein
MRPFSVNLFDCQQSNAMFHDDEIDEVFLEVRKLSRLLGGSSTPIIRDIIRSMAITGRQLFAGSRGVVDGDDG